MTLFKQKCRIAKIMQPSLQIWIFRLAGCHLDSIHQRNLSWTVRMAFGKRKVKQTFWSSVYSVSLDGHPLQKALRSSCLGPGWFSSVISILIWLQRTILNSITESSSNRFNQLCWNVPPPLQPKTLSFTKCFMALKLNGDVGGKTSRNNWTRAWIEHNSK